MLDQGVSMSGRSREVPHKTWTVVLAILRRSVHLGQRHHGDLELARHELEPAGEASHLLLTRVAAIVRVDELQVIDHHQFDPMPQLQSPRIGGDSFIKLFTHGAQERNSNGLLGGVLESAFNLLVEEAARRRCSIHFASAWQMYLAIEAIRERRDPVAAWQNGQTETIGAENEAIPC